MAKLISRILGNPDKPETLTRTLLIMPENEEESKVIDETLSSTIPSFVYGKVDLADGYGEHYLALRCIPKETALTQAIQKLME